MKVKTLFTKIDNEQSQYYKVLTIPLEIVNIFHVHPPLFLRTSAAMKCNISECMHDT